MGHLWLLATVTALPSLAAAMDAGTGADATRSAAGVSAIDAQAAQLDSAAQASRSAAAAPAGAPSLRRAVQSLAARSARPPSAPAVRPVQGRRGRRMRGAAGPCVAQETAHYRVTFGILGQVAEATLSVEPGAEPAPAGVAESPLLLRATGAGSGNVLGFGKMDKRIETDFDARVLGTRRWSSVKIKGGKTTSDTVEQTEPGKVALLRKRTGTGDVAESFQRAAPVLDPLSFLLRLRLAPPTAETVYEVLDGRALWLAKVSAARVERANRGLLRVDGKLDPIYWSGGADQKRSSYAFSLFFKRDRFRTPVRMIVPYGLGQMRAELVAVERQAGDLGVAVDSGLACAEPRQRSFWRSVGRGWTKNARTHMSRGRAGPRGAAGTARAQGSSSK